MVIFFFFLHLPRSFLCFPAFRRGLSCFFFSLSSLLLPQSICCCGSFIRIYTYYSLLSAEPSHLCLKVTFFDCFSWLLFSFGSDTLIWSFFFRCFFPELMCTFCDCFDLKHFFFRSFLLSFLSSMDHFDHLQSASSSPILKISFSLSLSQY